ncbi:MAG TPA: PA domain-containing protein, partial [Nitriliruptorales bacterium]|nr:PA domain-containing protein [Nitriliruptorales bacterium]
MTRPVRLVAFATLVLATALLVALPPAAVANHTEDRAGGGLVEVGFHPLLNAGFNTDVWAWTSADDRLFAASGTWGSSEACPSQDDDPTRPQRSGVKVVDATDPQQPRLVATLGTVPGAQNNDVKVLAVDTGAFTGHLLVHSLEPCGVEGLLAQVDAVDDVPRPQTGFQLYDVSEPTAPRMLSAYNNGGIGTHNLFPFARPDLGGAFVAAVFNEAPLVQQQLVEGDLRGEVQFVDVSDPNAPQLVSSWELADAEGQGGGAVADLCVRRGEHIGSCYLHDVWVSDDGRTAYLSFWDAGLILLDISDVANPTLIGHVQPGGTDNEGNTHAAVPFRLGRRQLVIVGDEDFVGGAAADSILTVNQPTDLAGDREYAQWAGTAEPEPAVTADLVYAGTGCSPLNYSMVEAAGKIAIVDDGQGGGSHPGDVCPASTFVQMAQSAQQAGAVGLISVEPGEELPNATAVQADIPAGSIKFSEGAPIVERVVAGERVSATLRLDPRTNPWGFMRVVDVTDPDPAKWRQVATFAAPHVEDPEPGEGDVFSAHNPIVGPDGRVYFAWYTDGVRVLQLAEAGRDVAVDEVAW